MIQARLINKTKNFDAVIVHRDTYRTIRWIAKRFVIQIQKKEQLS